MVKFNKFFVLNFFIPLFFISSSLGEIVREINISGNNRISNETILVFSKVKVGDDIQDFNLNSILKDLYETNFFEDVSVKLSNGEFFITVEESPLIQNIDITGIKAKKFKDLIISKTTLKSKSSYSKDLLTTEVNFIKSLLKAEGFYFTKVNAIVTELENNLVDIEYKIDMGKKSKISKISFIGDKVYKNKKLRDIIVSEEYKFWKFISGKKFLREELITLDKRLLKNFYLNNGFYNVKINSSFAKFLDNNEFELIFNINPGKKIFFGDLKILLPNDFNDENYEDLIKLFEELKDKPYSINSVDKILNEIDNITLNEEFKTVNAFVDEVLENNKLNINFKIEEAQKLFVEKINIFGNNITREDVIRNQIIMDEGDPYSSILAKKSENQIKNLNFFRDVKTSTVDGNGQNSKILNIEVKEKPTGEITAGAGAGTDGGSLFFGVKENNYLGKGLSVSTNATISDDSFKGLFSVSNPNYNNSDKSIFFNMQAIEIDKLKKFGYKTNKNGFEIGSRFEYYDDLYLGVTTSNFAEKIETNSSASARQKKQAGNYFDSFLDLDINYDKRNQKFKTTDGYFSNYGIKLPVLSDTNTLTNSYNFKSYHELYDNNRSSFSILLQNATSISNDDVKLTERLYLPSNRLRGFENGKIGPKDGNDFIGGNYAASINLQSSLPVLFENTEELDAIIFMDAGNVWGVDYSSSINDGSKIRSSIGIGVDWMTIVGPLNFSFTEVITKESTDVEESFRFNLGTTF